MLARSDFPSLSSSYCTMFHVPLYGNHTAISVRQIKMPFRSLLSRCKTRLATRLSRHPVLLSLACNRGLLLQQRARYRRRLPPVFRGIIHSISKSHRKSRFLCLKCTGGREDARILYTCVPDSGNLKRTQSSRPERTPDFL